MNKTFMYVMKRSVHAYRVFQFFNFRHGVSYKKVCGESNDVMRPYDDYEALKKLELFFSGNNKKKINFQTLISEFFTEI